MAYYEILALDAADDRDVRSGASVFAMASVINPAVTVHGVSHRRGCRRCSTASWCRIKTLRSAMPSSRRDNRSHVVTRVMKGRQPQAHDR